MIRAVFGKLFRNFWINDISSDRTPCRDFFDRRNELAESFWPELGNAHPGCVCEAVAVSEYSPGPVEDAETLVSVVTSTGYVSPEGRVEPTLFESRMSNGISTDRRKHTSLEDYDRRAVSLVASNAKKLNCGSIELSVGRIREINHNGERAIAVYDTALKENTSHAEIACTEVPPQGTPGRTKLRAALRKRVLDSALHDGRVLNSSQIFQVR
jgi:hypothetical protein